MAGEAILQTGLSYSDLYPSALSSVMQGGRNFSLDPTVRQLVERVRFSNDRLFFFDPRNAGRASSLDLRSGELALGDVQNEEPPVRILSREHDLGIRGNVSTSIVFELERLFSRPLDRFEPDKMFYDGNLSRFPSRLADELHTWAADYRVRMESSSIHKPTIQDHYKKDPYSVSRDLRQQLYGIEVLSLLSAR